MRKNILAAFCFTCFLAAGMLGCKKDNAGAHNTGAAMTVDSFIATQGGGGTEILVSGNNFSSDTLSVRVFINGHRLAVVNANYHQIMAVVPKKCGSGKVIVIIGRDSAVSKGIFNYTYTHIVSTLAGNGVAGFANGNGTDAQFNFNGQAWYRSSGVAVDDKLNVYVADPGNSCIRKIDSLGNVTTFAGSPGNGGYADGQGSAARFSIPYDVAVDGAGNVYSVDPGNWDIRKITPNGTATALAWGNQAPWSVAVDKTTGYVYYTSCDPSGNVYPVDAQGNTGSPVVTGLKYPAGIGFDKTGNLYVSMNGEQVIRKYTAGSWTGSIIAGQAGSSGYVNGPGPSAKFAYPWGLALDSAGNIYIAGNGTWDGGTYNADQSIRYIKANTWQVSSFAGSNNAGYVDAIGQAAAFSAPTGVAVDKYGNVYVLDKNNNRIRKIVSE